MNMDRKIEDVLCRAVMLLVASLLGPTSLANDDNQKFVQTVWEIETPDGLFQPESIQHGCVLDLSNAVLLNQIDRKYRIYGDSLISRTVGAEQAWFELEGDTIYNIGSNSRTTINLYSAPIPYLFRSWDVNPISVTESTLVNYCNILNGTIERYVEVATLPGGDFVFAGSDTVRTSFCIRTVSLCNGYRHANYRWYADGCDFAVLEYNSYCADGISESLCRTYICPPEEQQQISNQASKIKRRQSAVKEYDMAAKSNYVTEVKEPLATRLSANEYSINADGCRLSVMFKEDMPSASSTTSETGRVSLCDAYGRVLYTQTGGISYDTSILPQGVYIVYIIRGNKYESKKIYVDPNSVRL